MNQELTQSQTSNLSKDLETEELDTQAAKSWIFPTNYSTREYQFNIIQKALLKNTLVSLPTGLGKTFIAAVVMYNFYRWYPLGKIIFMAPTKPLVKQQVDACYNIMAIPKEVTAELTGTTVSSARTDIWNEKRVFFVTPDTLKNDLNKIMELGPKIKCLVFDEAHKAKRNHAYCEVIRRLVSQNNKYFRVLALSATPGSSVNDVLEVIQNLLISHLEFRTEESIDVQPYVFQRSLETVVVPLGDKLQEVREEYLKVLEDYTRALIKLKVIQGNCSTLTKGKIFMIKKEFQEKHNSAQYPNYKKILLSLNISITLYHAFELLVRHGLRSFLSFFEEHTDKSALKGIINIMEDIKQYLGPAPSIDPLPDGTYPEIPHDVKFGHPKFYKLRDILVSHFTESSDSSRVIVFFEYKESVKEAYALLLQARPLIKPRIFIGQGSGVTQRVQANVVAAFREGKCNVLLSTCIGEEGLDVGEVDLIVCFDISNKSPVRMIQRMGRTGRRRKGRIIVMVTEGREQQTLKDCLIQKNNIANYVLSSKMLSNGMYPASPRLLPANVEPKCEKIYITVQKPVLTKNSSVKDMLRHMSRNSSEPSFSPDLEIIEIEEKIPETTMLWKRSMPLDGDFDNNNIFHKRKEKQRVLQPIHKIKHSKSSEILVDLLQLADSKRFNIPVSQIQGQSKSKLLLKQADIRNMFFKTVSQNDFELPSVFKAPEIDISPSPSIINETEEVDQNQNQNPIFTKEIFTEISNYLSIQMSVSKTCRHCPDSIDCSKFSLPTKTVDFTNWVQLEESVYEDLMVEDFNIFAESLSPKSKKIYNDFELNISVDSNSTRVLPEAKKDVKNEELLDAIFDNVNFTQIEKDIEGNFDSDEEKIKGHSFLYQAPKSFASILDNYSTSIVYTPEDKEIASKSSQNVASKDESPQHFLEECKNLDKNRNSKKELTTDELLHFFKLSVITDLFPDNTIIEDSQDTIIYSPDVLSPVLGKSIIQEFKSPEETKTSNDDIPESPVLSKCARAREKRRKIMFHRSKTPDLFLDESLHENVIAGNSTPNTPDLQNIGLYNKAKEIDTPSKFTMDATKLSSTPKHFNIGCEVSGVEVNKNHNSKDTESKVKENADIDDFCDLSIFGIQEGKTEKPLKKQDTDSSDSNTFKINESESNLDIDDFCDVSSFGILTQPLKNYKNTPKLKQTKNSPLKNKKVTDKLFQKNSSCLGQDLNDDSTIFGLATQKIREGATQPNENNLEIHDFCDTSGFVILSQPIKNGKTEDKKGKEIVNKNKPLKLYKLLQKQSNLSGQALDHDLATQKIKEKELNLDDLNQTSIFEMLTQPLKAQEFKQSINEKSPSRKQNVPAKLSQMKSIPTTQVMEFDDSIVFDIATQRISTTEKDHNIDDFCDTSIFGVATQPESQTRKKPTEINLNSFCDLSEFGIPTQPIKNDNIDSVLDKSVFEIATQRIKDVKTPKEMIESSDDLSIFEASTQAVITDKTSEQIAHSGNDYNNSSLNINDDVTYCKRAQNKDKAPVKDFVDLTEDSPEKSIPNLNKSVSQLSITQMLSLMAKETSQTSTSQKKNKDSTNIVNKTVSKTNNNLSLLDDLANFEEFNISFNKKKITPPSKKSKLSTNKNTQTKLVFPSPRRKCAKEDIDPYKLPTQNSRNLNRASALNMSTYTTSDDEFEDKPKSPIWIKPKPKTLQPKKVESIESFITPSTSRPIQNKRKKANPFLEEEADLSEDDNVFVSDDEEEIDLDRYDESFVADETQSFDTQMQAKYLQSVRSPANRGRFKIPVRPRQNISNIYSQVVNHEDNTYLEDSFVVDAEDDELTDHELSELEILEIKLKKIKKNKRRKSDENLKPSKRRRIIQVLDDSD